MKSKLLLLTLNLLLFSSLASNDLFAVNHPKNGVPTENLNNTLSISSPTLHAALVPFTVATHTTPASCETTSDGTVVVYASGGVTPYGSYSIVGPGTNLANNSGIFTGLMPGVYTVSATDGGGTTVTGSALVGIANALTVTPNVSICPGNSTTLGVTGSNAPYLWSAAPADATLTTPTSASPTVSPTVTTNYTVTSTPTTVVDLIYNGDFSQGNTAFLTDYTYFNPVNVGGLPGRYGVVTNPSTWSVGYSACGDHTTGTGNMLVVDGSILNAGNDMVWSQIVPVIPGQNYTFSYWVQSVGLTNPAALETFINGTSMGAADLAPAVVTCGNWVQRTFTWNSGASNTAQIILYDRTITPLGNDFAIDDISFTTTLSCTISETVTVSMATASMFGNTTIGVGGSAVITFVGSPFATVNFTSPLGPGSVVLDATGNATYNIPYIATTTTFTLVSVTTIATPSTPSCTRPLVGSVTITVNSNTCTLPLVEVSIDAPGPVCNLGDCTELLAHFSNRGEPTDYIVTPIPYCPSFPFTGGTVINATGDDTWSPIVNLPFDFNFYGNCYDQVLVGTNGVITFDLVNEVPLGNCNWPFTATIPNAAFPIKSAIYGVYQDTNIASPPVTNTAVQNVNYYVLDTGPNAAPNRVFVANFNELPQFSCNASVGFQTSQIVIHETTNIIEVFVNKRTSCTGWNSGSGLIGVLNQAGNLATVPPGRNTGTWSATNEAWRFLPKNIPTIPTTIQWYEGTTPVGAPNQNPLPICPTGPTTYTAVVTYTNCGTVSVSESINVDVAPPLPVLNPVNINICSSALPPYTVNINQTAAILAGVPSPGNYFIKYYENFTAAENDAPGNIPNAQLNNFTFSGPIPKTIYVRIEDLVTTGCYNVRPFTITIGSPTGTIAYPASPYCNNIPTPQSITENNLTPGGTYSAVSIPPGLNLSINPTNGAIIPNLSDVGQYTVTYSIAANPPCPAFDTSTNVEIVLCSCAATASSSSETLCVGTALTPITYTTPGASSASVTSGALPPGTSGTFNAGTGIFTVSGTPSTPGTYNYTVSVVSGLDTCMASTVIVVNPNATISLTSAASTTAQTVCIGTAISNIAYTVANGATGATVTGLPASVTGTFAAGVFTISGSPSAAGTFNYTVTTTGGCSSASLSGTIIVNPNATIVLSSAASTTNQTVCVNTAITPITYTIANGGTGATVLGLPIGVSGSFAAGTYTINGSPSSPGTYNYTITTTGGCSSASLTGTIIVNPNATITQTSAAGTEAQTVCVNTAIAAITYSIGNGGTGATVTGLPLGVAGVYAAGVFTITGTPTGVGTYNYTVTTTGGCSSASLSGSIIVSPNVTIALTSPAATANQTVCINTPITNIVYTTANGATNVTVTGLPAGVTGAFAAGVFTISGSPSAAGTFNYTVTTAGGCGIATLNGTITVNPNATIALTSATATANQTVCVNQAITQITYTVADGATGATVTGLPAGITGVFNAGAGTFAINGSSAATGTFNYTVTTTGGCSSASLSGSIIINPDVTVTLTSAAATANQTVCISSPITNIVYTIANGATGMTDLGFPAGVTGSYNSATGVYTISGTPTVDGIFNYTITTVGGCGTASANGTITVSPAATIALTSAIGTDAQTVCVNTPITAIQYTIGNGGTGATVLGLPTGVTGTFAGGLFTIVGTPSAPGTYNYTVTTTGGCSSSSLTGTIIVNPNATIGLDVPGTDNQTVCNNTAITPILYVIGNGGTGATISPALPTGLTGFYDAVNNTYSITGSTLVVGTYNYTITTTGGCSSASATGTIIVNPNATIGQLSPAGTETQTLCINTAITAITYLVGNGATGATASGLPAGVTGSFNSGTGVFTISGTPTVAGVFNIDIDTVGGCSSAQLTATITVNPNATITLTSAAGTDNQTVCNNVAITPIVYTVANGGTGATVTGLPLGIAGVYNSATNEFTISGSTLLVGTYNYSVTTTGGCSSATLTGTIIISPDVTIALNVAGTDIQTVCINTAITPIAYTIANGGTGATTTGLPAGVTGSFNSGTGVYTLSGSPTVDGTFVYTVTTTGGCASDSLGGTITVNPNATIALTSGSAIQTVCINTAITTIEYTVANGATGATVIGLPTGVTGTFAGNVFTITGTPTSAGTFGYTVTTTGGCSSASLTGTITVNPNVTIALTSANNTQTVCVGTPIAAINYAIANSGAAGATVTGLPAGVTGSFNLTTGIFTITGSPSANGVYPYTITTSGGCSSAFLTGTITVNPNVTIALTSPAATANQTLCISTAITPVVFTVGNLATGALISSGGLPLGVTGTFNSVNGTFTISGTPTSAGTFNYNVSTSGGCSVASLSGVIVVNPAVTLTLTSAPGTTNQTICQNTGVATITYLPGNGATGATVTGLPAGVTGSFNSTTGVFTISGITTVLGTHNYTVTTVGGCSSASLSGIIEVTPSASISLTSAPGTDGQQICVIQESLVAIQYTVANGATGAFIVSGTVPVGVSGSFNAASGTFTIVGTPIEAGTFTYVVRTTGGCSFGEISGTIRVSPLPVITLPADGYICVDENGLPKAGSTFELTTGILPTNHTFEWSDASGVIPTATGNSYIATAPGDYSVTVTNTITGCFNTATTTVISSYPPLSVKATASQFFTQDQIVTVVALPIGNYEYQVDNGAWQDSNQFFNLPSGEHHFVVRDKIGCGELPTSIIIIDYPKFFTPNNDGYNDTWNIVDLNILTNQETDKIEIYDRYGKLLKEISPKGKGWDGTLNGKPLPSTDYWFKVYYVEEGVSKEFKAHFALKR